MSTEKKQFQDKDVIFREGDRATLAFIVIGGKVELTQEVEGGTKRIGFMGPGKHIAVNDLAAGVHQTTATAVGTVTLKPVPVSGPAGAPQRRSGRDNAAGAGEQGTAAAGGGLWGLVKRFLPPPPPPESGMPPLRTKRFSLLGFFRRIKEVGQPDPNRIDIKISPLRDDPGNITSLIAGLLDARDGVRARVLKKPVEVSEGVPPDMYAAALHQSARQALAPTEGDLCVMIEALQGEQTLRLRFLPLGVPDEDAPGALQPAMALTIPAQPEAVFADFLVALAVAASVPLSEEKRKTRTDLLPALIEAAMPILEANPRELLTRDQAALSIFMADLIYQLSHIKGQMALLRNAVELYRRAITLLETVEGSIEKAQAQRHAAMILQGLAPELEEAETAAEDSEAVTPLRQAIDLMVSAQEVLTKEAYPREWAALQHRIGLCHYRLDAASNEPGLLKDCLNRYQAALQIYTRADHPQRWGEVMSNFGLAAAVMGEQLRSVELLEKAVEACDNALQVRRKMDVPMLWASTQNNLGSALFMLGKLTNDDARFDAALEAFSLARGVYQDRGAPRMIMITEKNMTRVSRTMELKRLKNPPRLPWEPQDFTHHAAEMDQDADGNDNEAERLR